MAARMGLQAAVAFPILRHGEALGIMEFFSRAIAPPDAAQLAMLSAIGNQIGQFVERKLAEGLLREAHERITMILDSITDQFFAFDHDWRFTYVNTHAAAQMKALGKDPAGLIGSVLWEEFPDVPNEAAVRRVMTERVAMTDELYYAPLGEWVENHMYPSPDGGLVTFQKYITTRKRADEALRRSEAYLAEGQRLSQTASWAWNVSTGELFWSQELFRIYGVDPEQVKPGYPMVLHYIHPDDRSRVQQMFEHAVRDTRDYELAYRVVWPDGTIRHVNNLAHPVFNESGALTEYVGTTIDTTERIQAEAQLAASERRFRLVADAIPHLVWTCLPDGTVEYCNRR
jgi:PAS domain S-box-containing protein